MVADALGSASGARAEHGAAGGHLTDASVQPQALSCPLSFHPLSVADGGKYPGWCLWLLLVLSGLSRSAWREAARFSKALRLCPLTPCGPWGGFVPAPEPLLPFLAFLRSADPL